MSRGDYFYRIQELSEFLEEYTVPNLKKLAKLLTSKPPTRKAELVTLIHHQIKERLLQLFEYLTPLQKAAVAEVVHSASGQFDEAGFRAKYGEAPDWGQISPYGDLEQPSYLCLFIYDGQIPRDLKDLLKAFVPAPRAARVHSVDTLPATVSPQKHKYHDAANNREIDSEGIPLILCETERAAQHDVHAVLRLIDAGKIRVSEKTKRVTSAGARAISQVLHGGDFYSPDKEPYGYDPEPGFIKAFAWPLILQSAGLANSFGTKLQLSNAGRKALKSAVHQVIRKVWSSWLKTTLLDEFKRIDSIKGQTGKGKRQMTALSKRRATIVQGLKECPSHEWIAFDEFSRLMRASGYTFEVSRDLWSLYISDPNYGSLGYEGFGEWHIVQGRYMMVFLFEYAATMGLIDVAYIYPSEARFDYRSLWGVDNLNYLSRYDGLLYFRINGLGAWCLGLTQEYIPSPQDARQALKVLPNMEIVVIESLPPGDILFLRQFAEQISDAVWKIKSTRLLETLEQGHSISDIEAFLKANSGDNLPANVAIFFKEMAERASRLVDRGAARLIEAEDAVLANLIANNSRLRSLCMLAGERHIVVPANAENAFRRALRELGYGLPVSHDNESAY